MILVPDDRAYYVVEREELVGTEWRSARSRFHTRDSAVLFREELLRAEREDQTVRNISAVLDTRVHGRI